MHIRMFVTWHGGFAVSDQGKQGVASPLSGRGVSRELRPRSPGPLLRGRAACEAVAQPNRASHLHVHCAVPMNVTCAPHITAAIHVLGAIHASAVCEFKELGCC